MTLIFMSSNPEATALWRPREQLDHGSNDIRVKPFKW